MRVVFDKDTLEEALAPPKAQPGDFAAVVVGRSVTAESRMYGVVSIRLEEVFD
jgi:hypothetical protein